MLVSALPKLFWVLVSLTAAGQQVQSEPMIAEACILKMITKADSGDRTAHCVNTQTGKIMRPPAPLKYGRSL